MIPGKQSALHSVITTQEMQTLSVYKEKKWMLLQLHILHEGMLMWILQ